MLKDIPAHRSHSLKQVNQIQSQHWKLKQQFPNPYNLNIAALYISVPFHKAINNVLISLTDSYKRCVDNIYGHNIYGQTTDEAEADNFHKIMNQAYPNTKFKIETTESYPNGKSLSLLEFSYYNRASKTEFEIYKIEARKPVCMHCKSAVPKRLKTNIKLGIRG